MAMCLRLKTGRHGVRLVKSRKPALSHLQPRTGAWCWQRKANQQRLRQRLKNFAEPIGGHCTASRDAKARSQTKHRISLKRFSCGCWIGGTSKLLRRKRGGYELTQLGCLILLSIMRD